MRNTNRTRRLLWQFAQHRLNNCVFAIYYTYIYIYICNWMPKLVVGVKPAQPLRVQPQPPHTNSNKRTLQLDIELFSQNWNRWFINIFRRNKSECSEKMCSNWFFQLYSWVLNFPHELSFNKFVWKGRFEWIFDSYIELRQPPRPIQICGWCWRNVH